MSDKTYRVIQWMTGDVGQAGIRHFADCPTFELVSVLVHSKDKVVIDGDPPTELTMQGVRQPDGTMAHPGYPWTAMGAINAIPDVCDAPAGWLTYFDLGLIRPRGLVRT